MAKIYDRFMESAEREVLADWRRELLADARGHLLEIGAGTGLNLEHYPETVCGVTAVEPDPHMRAELARRVGRTPVPGLRIVDAEAESLPFDDDSFDTVVATLLLCSVEDVDRALGEIRRVLRPDGTYVFLEHVAARDNPGRLKWQERLEPVWKRLAGNCHLTRRTADRIREAGFSIQRIERASMRKAIPIVRPTIRGTAAIEQ